MRARAGVRACNYVWRQTDRRQTDKLRFAYAFVCVCVYVVWDVPGQRTPAHARARARTHTNTHTALALGLHGVLVAVLALRQGPAIYTLLQVPVPPTHTPTRSLAF